MDSGDALAHPAKLALRNAGANVRVTTPSGITSAIQERPPDVVVIGLKPHGAGGIATADYLRHHPATRTSAIIFIARGATEPEREAASDYGPVIDEPLHPTAFAALARDLHHEHRDTTSTARPTTHEPTYA